MPGTKSNDMVKVLFLKILLEFFRGELYRRWTTPVSNNIDALLFDRDTTSRIGPILALNGDLAVGSDQNEFQELRRVLHRLATSAGTALAGHSVLNGGTANEISQTILDRNCSFQKNFR